MMTNARKLSTAFLGTVSSLAAFFALLAGLKSRHGVQIQQFARLAQEQHKALLELHQLTGITREEIEMHVGRGWKLNDIRAFYLRWGCLPAGYDAREAIGDANR